MQRIDRTLAMNAQDPLLICLLPAPADLERAREGWYRVPLAHAPAALVGAKGLAFYQPASFGEARWRVEWWAPVRRVETLRRIELLPEEPEHRRAQEWYLCARLGPLETIEPPRKSGAGRRLLFVPTTWGAFTSAPDLDVLLSGQPGPIKDDPLYQIIQQQLAGQGGIPDPASTHQRRLLEASAAEYDSLDW